MFDLEKALADISEGTLQHHVEYLASKDGRKSGTDSYRLAVDYAKAVWYDAGLKILQQNVPSVKSDNVIGYIPSNSNEVVVLGAHLDHLGKNYPGADDNASGSSIVLELGRVLAKWKNPPRTLVFQLYTGEEEGLYGSKYYCRNPLFPINKPSINSHIAMLNFDMVGYFKGTGCDISSKEVDLEKFIRELNQKYSFGNRIIERGGGGGSDHASFYNNGVPVTFFHTGLHNNYHRPSDTPEKLNYLGMKNIAIYGLELTYKVMLSERPRQINFTEPMQTELDHNQRKFSEPGL